MPLMLICSMRFRTDAAPCRWRLQQFLGFIQHQREPRWNAAEPLEVKVEGRSAIRRFAFKVTKDRRFTGATGPRKAVAADLCLRIMDRTQFKVQEFKTNSLNSSTIEPNGIEHRRKSSPIRVETENADVHLYSHLQSIMRKRPIFPDHCEECRGFSHVGVIHRRRFRKIPCVAHFPPLTPPEPLPSPMSPTADFNSLPTDFLSFLSIDN